MGLFASKAEKEILKMAKSINGKHVAYATSRDNLTNEENVLGKNGSINVINGNEKKEIVILAGGEYVFRGELFKCKIGMLMSGNGITVKGFNIITNAIDTVTAYYVYHRK